MCSLRGKKWDKGEETSDLEAKKRNLERRQCLEQRKNTGGGGTKRRVQSLRAGLQA